MLETFSQITSWSHRREKCHHQRGLDVIDSGPLSYRCERDKIDILNISQAKLACPSSTSSPASVYRGDLYSLLGSCSVLLWDEFSNEQVFSMLGFLLILPGKVRVTTLKVSSLVP